MFVILYYYLNCDNTHEGCLSRYVILSSGQALLSLSQVCTVISLTSMHCYISHKYALLFLAQVCTSNISRSFNIYYLELFVLATSVPKLYSTVYHTEASTVKPGLKIFVNRQWSHTHITDIHSSSGFSTLRNFL